MNRIASGVLLAVAFVTGISAQSPPDYSGAWILADQTRISLNPIGITGGPGMTIEQDGRTIRINRQYGKYGNLGGHSRWTFTVNMDGSVSSHSGPILTWNARPELSRAVSSTAKWKGSDLVFLTTRTDTNKATPDQPASVLVVTEMLSLDGPFLRVGRFWQDPIDGQNHETHEIYFKKP